VGVLRELWLFAERGAVDLAHVEAVTVAQLVGDRRHRRCSGALRERALALGVRRLEALRRSSR